MGDAHRLAGMAQGIFDDHLVTALAQNNADGRLIVLVSKFIIDGREVEIRAPTLTLLPGQNIAADVPIQQDQFAID